jgi:hypothetical protein
MPSKLLSAQRAVSTTAQSLDDEDQRENARRELERRRIERLDGQVRRDAEAAEDERERLYDQRRSQMQSPQFHGYENGYAGAYGYEYPQLQSQWA